MNAIVLSYKGSGSHGYALKGQSNIAFQLYKAGIARSARGTKLVYVGHYEYVGDGGYGLLDASGHSNGKYRIEQISADPYFLMFRA